MLNLKFDLDLKFDMIDSMTSDFQDRKQHATCLYGLSTERT